MTLRTFLLWFSLVSNICEDLRQKQNVYASVSLHTFMLWLDWTKIKKNSNAYSHTLFHIMKTTTPVWVVKQTKNCIIMLCSCRHKLGISKQNVSNEVVFTKQKLISSFFSIMSYFKFNLLNFPATRYTKHIPDCWMKLWELFCNWLHVHKCVLNITLFVIESQWKMVINFFKCYYSKKC